MRVISGAISRRTIYIYIYIYIFIYLFICLFIYLFIFIFIFIFKLKFIYLFILRDFMPLLLTFRLGFVTGNRGLPSSGLQPT